MVMMTTHTMERETKSIYTEMSMSLASVEASFYSSIPVKSYHHLTRDQTKGNEQKLELPLLQGGVSRDKEKQRGASRESAPTGPNRPTDPSPSRQKEQEKNNRSPPPAHHHHHGFGFINRKIGARFYRNAPAAEPGGPGSS